MYSIKNCLVTAETLSSWEQKFVPVSDVYFFEKENSAIESLGAEVLLLSREQWIGNGLIFNTNGQTMFNPWQVLQVDTLLTDWHHVLQAGGNLRLYRQSIEDKKTPHQ